jgi:hypothetical protein
MHAARARSGADWTRRASTRHLAEPDTRRTIGAGAQMSWSAARGHDDYVAALALALHAASRASPPAFGVLTLAVDPYAHEGRY